MLYRRSSFERHKIERLSKVCPRQILVGAVRHNVTIMRNVGELPTTDLDENLTGMALDPCPDFFKLYQFSRPHSSCCPCAAGTADCPMCADTDQDLRQVRFEKVRSHAASSTEFSRRAGPACAEMRREQWHRQKIFYIIAQMLSLNQSDWSTFPRPCKFSQRQAPLRWRAGKQSIDRKSPHRLHIEINATGRFRSMQVCAGRNVSTPNAGSRR